MIRLALNSRKKLQRQHVATTLIECRVLLDKFSLCIVIQIALHTQDKWKPAKFLVAPQELYVSWINLYRNENRNHENNESPKRVSPKLAKVLKVFLRACFGMVCRKSRLLDNSIETIERSRARDISIRLITLKERGSGSSVSEPV